MMTSRRLVYYVFKGLTLPTTLTVRYEGRFCPWVDFQDENVAIVANTSRMTYLDVPPMRAIGTSAPHRHFCEYVDA